MQGRRHGFLPGVAKLNGGLHPEGASWQKGPLFEILLNVLNRRISEATTAARRILCCSWHTPSDRVIPGVCQNFEANVLRAPEPNASEYILRTCQPTRQNNEGNLPWIIRHMAWRRLAIYLCYERVLSIVMWWLLWHNTHLEIFNWL